MLYLAENLRSLRLGKGMTQEELAEARACRLGGKAEITYTGSPFFYRIGSFSCCIFFWNMVQ